MRSMCAAWCSGQSGTPRMMAEQFGTAMMPLCFARSPALISGTTSGTSGLHAEGRRIVDHHRAGLLAGVGEFARAGRPGAEERVVDVRQRPRRAAPRSASACPRTRPSCPATATRRAPSGWLTGKLAPLQRAQDFLAHRAGGADDGNAIRFHEPVSCSLTGPRKQRSVTAADASGDPPPPPLMASPSVTATAMSATRMPAASDMGRRRGRVAELRARHARK